VEELLDAARDFASDAMLGEISQQEFIDRARSQIQALLTSINDDIEAMKYNNEEPSGCDCGGDTKGVHDAALQTIQSHLTKYYS
jgi:hypothetical protein